jgi:drug/metabolite transporter (DMT)-like permease
MIKRIITHRIGFLFMILFVTLLWGSPAPLIKLSYHWLEIQYDEYGTQLVFAGYRFFLSALFLYLFIRITTKQNVFTPSAFRHLTKVGVIQNFLQYIFFYIGLSLTTSMVTVIFTGAASLFQIVIAHFIDPDDRLNIRKITGVSFGFLGIFMTSYHSISTGLGFGLGEILLLLANLMAAVGTILAREESARFTTEVITFYQLFIGSLCLIAVGTWQAGFLPFRFDFISGVTFIYLALVAVIATYFWNMLLRYHPVSKVSIFQFLIPIFGVFLSALLIKEVVSSFTLLGLIFVCLGTVIVNKPRNKIQKRNSTTSVE